MIYKPFIRLLADSVEQIPRSLNPAVEKLRRKIVHLLPDESDKSRSASIPFGPEKSCKNLLKIFETFRDAVDISAVKRDSIR
jgi:hypothetical protein